METTTALCPSGVGLGRLSPCRLACYTARNKANKRLHIEQQTNKKDLLKHHKIYIHIDFLSLKYIHVFVLISQIGETMGGIVEKIWNCENIDTVMFLSLQKF